MNGRASGRLVALALWLPGLLFLTYLTATVCLFFWGPWQYPLGDTRPLIVFLVLAHAALLAGYMLGIRGRPAAPARLRIDPRRVALACVLCELILLAPTAAYSTGSWMPNPGATIADFGGAYTRSLERREQGVPYVNYVRIVVSPLLAGALPLCIFYWRRLGVLLKGLFVISTLGTLALSVAMGINAGVGNWLVLFPWFVLATVLSGEHHLTRRAWVAAGVVLVASVALFACLFALSMNVRAGSFARTGVLGATGAVLPGAVASDPADHPSRAAFEGRGPARIAFDGLAAYLSHGYYAVYLSLREPFVPMYGSGHSLFLQRQVARLTGDANWPSRSYPRRIEPHGWSAYGLWATIYPWIASDVGFPGTVAVMFLIGLLLGRVWVDVLGGQNPWAVMLLGQILLLMYYIPAHNKVMQAGEGVVAFWVLGLAWVLAGRRALEPSRATEQAA